MLNILEWYLEIYKNSKGTDAKRYLIHVPDLRSMYMHKNEVLMLVKVLNVAVLSNKKNEI